MSNDNNDTTDSLDDFQWLQLFNQLCIRLICQDLPDQIGVVIQADKNFDNKKYVLFHNGSQMSVQDLDDQSLEEFTTVSFGILN